mmetsp:Transcript_42877/g.99615  ORF Transcript_42877/g.99615 Transcript_42877/m.99615 type:complete len:293 (+) Transcript_42877:645-1523(+)
MFQSLQDEHSRPLPHHKARAVHVERPGPSSRIVIELCVHCLHSAESSKAKGGDGRLAPPSNHDVGVPPADRMHSLPDGVRPHRARGGYSEVGALGAELDAHDAGGRVTEKGRDGEGGDLLGTTLVELESLVLIRLHTPKGRAYHDPKPCLIDLSEVEPRVLDRHPARAHGEVGEPVVAFGRLGTREEVSGGEVGHLRANLARVVTDVEAGDLGDAALARDDAIPEGIEGVELVPYAGHDPETSHDHRPRGVGGHGHPERSPAIFARRGGEESRLPVGEGQFGSGWREGESGA